MNPNRDREEQIFDAAREIASPEERAAYLTQACGEDAALRQRVEQMLNADAAASEFFQTRAAQPQPPTVQLAASNSPSLTEKPGDRIGRYKLLQKLGEGGCGVVYMAEQTEPVKRRVALKVIKLGMDTKAVVARFEAERQALALMDHPNIARVLDAGATEAGRPYFVMELVRGIRITEYCDQAHLSTRERLTLFIQICQAVQHAHQKGIIHRDLKPSNILVTVNDGVPVPKVIDFGIAKATTGQQLTDKTLFTAYEQFIGTPAYMSPEQAVMTSLDIDTRTDIYSLGVLLYEMLTGRTPFDAQELLQAGLDEMRRRIREEEPERPSTRLSTMLAADLTTVAQHHGAQPPALVNLLRGDLDWIVMKALEKDRARRYETATNLAADIQRHLNNEPVVARPPSQLYRLQKLARRKRTAFAAVAAVCAAILIGLAVSAWQAIRATRAQRAEAKARLAADRSRTSAEENARKATASERNAQRLLYAGDMTLAYKAWEEGNLSRAIDLLEAHRPKPGQADARGFEYFYLQELAKGEQEQVLDGHTNGVVSIAVSPDGKWLASRGETDTRLWDLQRRTLVAAWSSPRTQDAVGSRHDQGISFSYDSQYLAIEKEEGLQLCHVLTREMRILATGLAGKPLFSPVTNCIAFNRGVPETGKTGPGIRVWDYLANKEVGVLPADRSIWCWSPDGSRLLTGQGSGATSDFLEWWDASTFKCVATNRVAQYLFGAVVSRDGRLTAAADWQGDIWLLESTGGRVLGSIPSGDIRPSAMAFSIDGKFLATASRDQAIQVWNIESRRRMREFRGHHGRVTSLAYTPDGQRLVSGGLDGRIMLWDVTHEARREQIPNGLAGFGLNPPQFSSDGKWLAVDTGRGGDSISILDASSFQLKASLRGEFLSFSPDASQVAMASGGSEAPALRISKLGAASPRATISLDSEAGNLRNPCLSRDGTLLELKTWEEKGSGTFLFDAATGESFFSVTNHGPPASQFLPDGRTWVTVEGTNINFWDLRSRQKRHSLNCASEVSCLSVSSDGRYLAAARFDLKISLWDSRSGIELAPLAGHQAPVWALAFSPDGRALASGSEDRSIKLWDLATHRELATYDQEQAVYWLSFSPDNQVLVSGSIGSYQILRAPRSDALAFSGSSTVSLANLPTNSVWRIPDGQARPLPQVAAEKEQCFSNLVKIHAAIMSYRKEHLQMPDWLSDLIPDYLPDTNCLVCPVHARTRYSPGMTGGNDPRIFTSYSYEFSARTNTSPDRFGVWMPGDTMKAWKTKQLARYGDMVPVLRCQGHRPQLYINYAGERLDGDWYWRSAAYLNLRAKNPGEAERWCRKLELEANANDLGELAWRLATSYNAEERDGQTAVTFAEKAVALTSRKDHRFLDTLAAAYADVSQFDKAVSLQREAIALLKDNPSGRDFKIRAYEARLELYRRQSPYHE